VSGAASKVVSGWGLDGVTTFQRGFPIKISDGDGLYCSDSLDA
jgi:hypothetical protein